MGSHGGVSISRRSSAKRCFVNTLATTCNSFTLEDGIKTALSLFSIISKHSNVLIPE